MHDEYEPDEVTQDLPPRNAEASNALDVTRVADESGIFVVGVQDAEEATTFARCLLRKYPTFNGQTAVLDAHNTERGHMTFLVGSSVLTLTGYDLR